MTHNFRGFTLWLAECKGDYHGRMVGVSTSHHGKWGWKTGRDKVKGNAGEFHFPNLFPWPPSSSPRELPNIVLGCELLCIYSVIDSVLPFFLHFWKSKSFSTQKFHVTFFIYIIIELFLSFGVFFNITFTVL